MVDTILVSLLTGNDSSLTGNVYGVYGYGQAYRETGNSYCYGGHFLSYAGGNETATRLYGVFGKCATVSSASGSKTVTAAYGGLFEVESNADTITSGYGCIVTMDANAGTIHTGYQFYASYSISGGATVTTKRGIYLYGYAKLHRRQSYLYR